VYDAPRQAVWRAWTRPAELAQWWGKRGWNAILDSIVLDVRPGGTFRVTTVNADGEEMTSEATFTEVVEPERLSFGDAVVTFTDLGDGRTEMTFRTTVRSERAAAGVASAFDRLQEHLKEGPMSTVTGVDFVSIPSQDIETARDFYENVLGLEPSSVWQRPGEDAVGAEFETGTVTLALINCPGLGIEFSANPVPVALQVADVAKARAELEAKGVKFDDTIDSGVCHMAHFRDPDGNVLMLHHRYAPR
jgi:uncharacterized protein YndB with AHSA1/START domain/catechol 2,3-dioxygenase-like lactoylglutathione lyase family enzyme